MGGDVGLVHGGDERYRDDRRHGEYRLREKLGLRVVEMHDGKGDLRDEGDDDHRRPLAIVGEGRRNRESLFPR